MSDALFTPEQERRIREIVGEEIGEVLQGSTGLTRQQFEEMAKRAAYEALNQVLDQASEDQPG